MEGWTTYKFSEIIEEISDGGTPSRLNSNYFGGSIPWVVIDDIQDEIYDTKEKLTELGLKACSSKLWPEGSIILSTGATIGEVGIAKVPVATKQGICGIKLNNSLIDNVYFMYYLKHIKNLLNSLAQGSTIKEIRPNAIKEFTIFAPKSLDEQRLIGEILRKTDMSIDQTNLLGNKLYKITKGMMSDLLTKGLDDRGRIRSQITHEFKNSPLGAIPKDWEWGYLGKLYELKSGITPSRSNKSFFDEDGYNWVKTLDLNEGYIYSTQEKITQLALDSTSIKLMPKETILIAMYGGWEQIGRTAILAEESATNQAITSLYNPKTELHPEFVQLMLQQYRYKWKKFAVSTRKDPNITKSDIEQFIIAYPKDISEQIKIAGKIGSLKSTISLNEEKVFKIKREKTGLMQDLLKGKVRVTELLSKEVTVK